MATYKEIIGTNIEVVSSDPSNPVTGQVWYNTTTDQLKARQQFVGNAWSSGGDLTQVRSECGGTGTQTAGLVSGGLGTAVSGTTETYDGSTWTEVSDLNTARKAVAGGGTQTSALVFGGFITAVSNTSETYDGSSWTEGPNLATARRYLSGCGSDSTAVVGFGGGPSSSALTEEYNNLSEKLDQFQSQEKIEEKKQLEFSEKIDELNQETDTLLDELDKWQT